MGRNFNTNKKMLVSCEICRHFQSNRCEKFGIPILPEKFYDYCLHFRGKPLSEEDQEVLNVGWTEEDEEMFNEYQKVRKTLETLGMI